MAGKTNVPEEIRSIWTDSYVLFDNFYLMSDEDENWKKLAEEFAKIYMKHKENNHICEFYDIICRMIRERIDLNA